jgi:hypothetical protein
MEFNEFKLAIQRQFNKMKEQQLFRVSLDKDKLWETYLSSYPEGTNPIFRERTNHDCQCCRSFIKSVGNMVSIDNGKLVSIWDVTVGGEYQVVTDALSTFVKSYEVDNMFLHFEKNIGVDKNYQNTENGILTWEHFHIQLPDKFICRKIDIGTKLGDIRSTKDVMIRSLKEITTESVDTVLELIAQNSLYRGEENRFVLDEFLKLKKAFDKCKTPQEQDIFCWSRLSATPTSISKIRNTSIGTLLVDLSEGIDLERAVKAFESKVAPTNYKRPTALVTKAMIENAKQKLEELGLTSSLERRFAILEDISINNVLFADRSARKRMDNVFDEISAKTSDKVKNLDKVEEVTIDQFISNILPKVDSIEVMFENKHSSNLVSLIAPCDLTAKNMFKWPNPFSWSYNGEMTDSIKERVKTAGGNVEGDLRCSLSWYNYDDLDLHMKELSSRYEIYYGNRCSLSPNYGMLDVDMNANSGSTRTPVENICYADRRKMREGVYELLVHQFCCREMTNVGFEVEIEFDGVIHTFVYAKPVRHEDVVSVAKIQYSKKDGFKIIESLPSTQAVKEVWGIPTQTFHKVSVMMLSPNYWDNKVVGNKHYFFMLENCINDGKTRGFYNEFLTSELDQHRKVFEIVGSKMKTEESPNQLSGLGFSSTQRNSIMCRVKGSFTRTIKITF